MLAAAMSSWGRFDATKEMQLRDGVGGVVSNTGSASVGSEGSSSRMKAITQTVSGNPTPWLISLVGTALVLLAF
jgi:hypothetical protein